MHMGAPLSPGMSTCGVRQSAMAARFSGVSEAKVVISARMPSYACRRAMVAATTIERKVLLSSPHSTPAVAACKHGRAGVAPRGLPALVPSF